MYGAPTNQLVTVYFSKARGPVSRLIQWVCRSPFSHVSLSLEMPCLGLLMFEAAGTSIHLVGLARWTARHEIVYSRTLELTPEQSSACAATIYDTLEQPYSYLDFLGLGLSRIFGLSRIPRFLRRGFVCSTIIAHALGFPDASEMDPAELWEAITATPTFDPKTEGGN